MSTTVIFSQEKFHQHTVSIGETILKIATKYKINSTEIYAVNPDAVNGIKSNMVLLIPFATKKESQLVFFETNKNTIQHEVLAKETIYGIAKQNNISIEKLYEYNPDLQKLGLQEGQTIIITGDLQDKSQNIIDKKPLHDNLNSIWSKKVSNRKEDIVNVENLQLEKSKRPFQYIVLPKETLFSVSKKYEISILDLQNSNPEIENNTLKAGQKIIIPEKDIFKSVAINSKPILAETQSVLPKQKSKNELVQLQKNKIVESESDLRTAKISTGFSHDILPKESLYSIAKKYNISISDLKTANPYLESNSLKSGQKITIPSNAIISNSKANEKAKLNSQKVSSSEPLAAAKQEKILDQVAHQVLPKETKYGIAKKYNISVEELAKQNPIIEKKLLVGTVLTIQYVKEENATAILPNSNSNEFKSIKNETNALESSVNHDSFFIEELIAKASERIGTPYCIGGTSASGFDCSGLICYTFENSDIKLPRSSIEMAAYGSVIDKENAKKGDLIFFKTSARNQINHVGMVIDVNEDEIKFIHSANRGGVIISSTKESYYRRNFIQINRVF